MSSTSVRQPCAGRRTQSESVPMVCAEPSARVRSSLRPESRPLTDRVGRTAAAAPARAATAFDSVVVGLHGDDVASRRQVVRQVVGVIALAPGIAARRSSAQIASVDPEHVAVGRRYVQLRLRGVALQIEAPPGHEIAVARLGIAVGPDPSGRPVRYRRQFGRGDRIHGSLPATPNGGMVAPAAAGSRARQRAGATRASPRPRVAARR